MHKNRLLSVLAVLLLSAVFVFSGCSGGENDDKGVSGSVGGIVTDAQSGKPIEGVTVTVGSLTTLTDAKGIFAFDPVTEGKQEITGQKKGYDNYSSTVNIFVGEVTIKKFTMTKTAPGPEPEPDTGTVTGIVTIQNDRNSRAAQAIAGVKVSIGELSAESDENGLYTINDIPPGTGLAITANKDGFEGYEGTVNVTADQTVQHDIGIYPLFIQISSGYLHNLALKADGTVWAWGWNEWGMLGDGTLDNRNAMVQVLAPGADPANPTYLTDIVAISAGYNHSMALKSDGTVYAWGNNSYGQLGKGDTAGYTNIPVQVLAPGADPANPTYLTDISAIAAGALHSAALKSDGTVYAWGFNYYGQLGNGNSGSVIGIGIPLQVLAPGADPLNPTYLSDVTKITLGSHHSMALKSNGTVCAWGYNNSGQLGDGNTGFSESIPIHVLAPGADPLNPTYLTDVTAIEGSGSHSTAVRSGGTLYAWGNNCYGQLGDGTIDNKSTPVQVLAPGADPLNPTYLANVTAVSGGPETTSAVLSDGTVYAWGFNEQGQLGNGDTISKNIPVQVLGPGGTGFMGDVFMSAMGYYHTIAIQSNGTIWAWGFNIYGQLGDGTNDQSITPVQVQGTP